MDRRNQPSWQPDRQPGSNQQNHMPPPWQGVPQSPIPPQPFPSPFQPTPSPAPYPSTQPPFVRPLYRNQQPKPRRRLKAGWIIALAALVVVIVPGGLLAPSLLQRFQAGQSTPTGQQIAATQQAQATPTLTEREKDKQLAQQLVDKMSLDDLIGQLIIVNPFTLQDDLDWMISQQHVGGVILYSGAFQSEENTPEANKEQSQQLIQHLQASASTPLFISTDGEGGEIYRIAPAYPDDPFLIGSDVRATGDPQVATHEGQKAAERFNSLGINTSFAPTVDVYQSEENYMYYRSFGNTPEEVIKYAGADLSAMQQGGIIGTLKHFPGVGRATEDPHLGVVTIDASKEEFYQTDLAPFKYFVQSQNPYEQPGMIMTTYELVPSIDPDQPAQYSHTFITDILRQEFHYDGVVITDALTNMVPADALGIGPASILSLQAGCDLLLGARNSDEVATTIQAVKDALDNGTLTRERLQESAVRVLALKIHYKIIPDSMK